MNTKAMDKLIGKRVRQERESRRLTLEELSELCSVSVSYLGYVERGQRPPSFTILKKLSLALRINLARLIEVNPAEAQPRDDAGLDLFTLLPLVQKKSPQDRRRIIDYWKRNLQEAQELFSPPSSPGPRRKRS